MTTKLNNFNDMNTLASDAIHSYIQDGYRIDAKESMIDPVKDNDCTFKAVLKRDIDGIECKAIIRVSETGSDDKSKSSTYSKVEYVGDLKWSEETRTYSSSKYNYGKEQSAVDCKVSQKKINSKQDCRWNCLDEVIKLNNSTSKKDDVDHIKVDTKDTENDIYNKIVNKYQSKTADSYDKQKTDFTRNEDEQEDSLIALVKYLFNR